MNHKEVKSVLEGLLFVSGDEGLDLKQLAEIVELEKKEVRQLLEEMKVDYIRENRGIQLVEMAGTYQLTTLPEHSKYFERLASSPSHTTLTQAALETLAIIAYRQPITRAELEEVRGVKSERPLQTLMNKLLIKEVGRLDGPGRAILYGTTKEFLDYFGLNSLADLPDLEQQIEIEDIEKEADLLFQK